MSPEALLARLEQRLALLTDGARDLPPRQQTLRAAIAWSYDLLDAGEQMLFRRLAVFVGGCTLEAAEAVCNASGDLPLEVLDGLATLVDTSLLRQEADADGEPRFVMLETIREYALEQLETSGELEDARRRHASFFLAQAERLSQGVDQASWLDTMDMEHDNLRAALAWSRMAPENLIVGLQLAIALEPFWELRGHMTEGREYLAACWRTPRRPRRRSPAPGRSFWQPCWQGIRETSRSRVRSSWKARISVEALATRMVWLMRCAGSGMWPGYKVTMQRHEPGASRAWHCSGN